MAKKDKPDYTLILSAPIIAIALTEGMDEKEMNIFASFISEVASAIFLMLATQGEQELEL